MILTRLPNELLSIIVKLLGLSSNYSLRHVSKYLETLILKLHPEFGPSRFDRLGLDHSYRFNQVLFIVKNGIILDAVKYTHLFKWLIPDISKLPMRYIERYCTQAANDGNINVLKSVSDNIWSSLKPHNMLIASIEGDHFDIFNWIVGKYYTTVNISWLLNSNVSTAAGEYGRLNIIKLLHTYGSLTYGTFIGAIHGGHLDILKWLHEYAEKYICKSGSAYMTNAARYGHFEMLRWLHTIGYSWNENICEAAAKNGHFEMLKWLHENGCDWNGASYVGAAGCSVEATGLEMIKYLYENGCPFDVDDEWKLYDSPYDNACTVAAKGCNFEILRWFHQNGYPFDEHTFENAIVSGDFEILKWLHENGCSWDQYAYVEAVGIGRIDIIQWLYENGCPLNKHVLVAAARNGHTEILKWLQTKLRENGDQLNDNDLLCSAAAVNGDLEMLKWLHENGCPLDQNACVHAAIHGHLDILIYLHENGVHYNDLEYKRALENDHLEVAKWLKYNYSRSVRINQKPFHFVNDLSLCYITFYEKSFKK